MHNQFTSQPKSLGFMTDEQFGQLKSQSEELQPQVENLGIMSDEKFGQLKSQSNQGQPDSLGVMSEQQFQNLKNEVNNNNDLFLKSKPSQTFKSRFQNIKEKLPFTSSGFEKGIRQEVINAYPFNEQAKKVINKLDIKDISIQNIHSPFFKIEDKEHFEDTQRGNYWGGRYRPSGSQISSLLTGDLLKKTLAEFLDREDIKLFDLDTHVAAHEFTHALFRRKPELKRARYTEKGADIRLPPEGVKFLNKFSSDWDKLKKDNPILEDIDQHLRESNRLYGNIFERPFNLATERSAYLVQRALKGTDIIPRDLRKYFQDILKFD